MYTCLETAFLQISYAIRMHDVVERVEGYPRKVFFGERLMLYLSMVEST